MDDRHGTILLFLAVGLGFAIYEALRWHRKRIALRARVAEAERDLPIVQAAGSGGGWGLDGETESSGGGGCPGTLTWGGDPVPLVFAPADTAQGRGGQVIVTDFSLGVGHMQGGSGGSGGILVADGEAEAGMEGGVMSKQTPWQPCEIGPTVYATDDDLRNQSARYVSRVAELEFENQRLVKRVAELESLVVALAEKEDAAP